VTSEAPDPWPAIDELASMLNDLAGQVLTHTTQLQHLTPTRQNTQAGNAAAHAKELRAWMDALVDEYGLHAQIGPPDRWENIPPLRAELLALKIADVRRLKLEQGSFELIYWHDALARIVDRASQHADRGQQDQQNQQLLAVAAR
jgi:hypothetical protein